MNSFSLQAISSKLIISSTNFKVKTLPISLEASGDNTVLLSKDSIEN